MNWILIILCFLVIVLIVLCIVILGKLFTIKNTDNEKLKLELRNEIDKSRQETINTVQNSVKTMANVIAQNQKTTAEIQSRRLNEMNKYLNESLEQVNKGLGEMESLTVGVADLKKILSNVKTRGIVGEYQLGAILEQILAPGQYEENISVTGSKERVEFAIKFPGEGEESIYLPVDSKFPADAYIHLQEAYDTGDKLLIKKASDNLKAALFKSARDIKEKYIMPPYTTEFAIMFIPFEGLYAEALRLGTIDKLQQDYRVTIAGPTTMAAIVNSFQMGFRSLALAKKSGQVWDTLSKAKSEFEKFEEVLVKVQGRLATTQRDLDQLVGARTKAIQKALRDVDTLQDNDPYEEE